MNIQTPVFFAGKFGEGFVVSGDDMPRELRRMYRRLRRAEIDRREARWLITSILWMSMSNNVVQRVNVRDARTFTAVNEVTLTVNK